MAHAPARYSSPRDSGDCEMSKPRKVALITGITGQVSAKAGGDRACCHPGTCARGPSAGTRVSRSSCQGIPEGVCGRDGDRGCSGGSVLRVECGVDPRLLVFLWGM
jgi:hypothetical protein|uniref:Uncharacterized protein n=1 Tax=Castor canadensis TaxID=51338 RepID=A0A8C0XVM3_CASCN